MPACRPATSGLVISANALGGRLCDQGCIRGQSWLRDVDLGTTGVVNVDNSCAGGSSAMHLGVLAAQAGQSPVLVVGVEKMWTGHRGETIAGHRGRACPSDERAELRVSLDNDAGSVLMALNATWVRHQIEDRGTTAAADRRRRGQGPPLRVAQPSGAVPHAGHRGGGPCVAGRGGPLDPADVLVVHRRRRRRRAVGGHRAGAPRVRASILRSGHGELDYHDRLRETADEAWKEAGVGPEDIDVVELHDATSAEELYALESLGFFPAGEAGVATVAGRHRRRRAGRVRQPERGPRRPRPSARGHRHLPDRRARRPAAGQGRRAARSTSPVWAWPSTPAGSWRGKDTALVAIHVLERA